MHSKIVIAGIVLLTLAAGLFWLRGGPFDFAVAVRPGWHVTIFPPPLVVPVVLALAGAGLLGLALMTRSVS